MRRPLHRTVRGRATRAPAGKLGEARRRALVARGRPAAWRLRSVAGAVRFLDDLHGEVVGAPDDVVLRRNDGVPAYNLAVVVDDHDDGIDQVVRADDLLGVTASQAHVADRLGFHRPRWAHVPLVLGPDGARLAKRHGAVTLAELLGGRRRQAWRGRPAGRQRRVGRRRRGGLAP